MHKRDQKISRPFRVLSLDGGGMRGLYTAEVLHNLAHRFSQGNGANLDIGRGFDLIVGTSTGGILACGLAVGVPITTIRDMYLNHGSDIFPSPQPTNFIKKCWWILKHLKSPANNNKALRQALQETFDEITLQDVYQSRSIGLCLTSINMMTYQPRVFKTSHNPQKNADNRRKLVDVCMATSAAPIIFPIAQIQNPEANCLESFVDGGLWSNNPIMLAILEAMELTELDQPIEILSVSTCAPVKGELIAPKSVRRGIWSWQFGIGVLDLAMEAQAMGNKFAAKFLADHLNKLGRKIDIIRLENRATSKNHGMCLSLDNASQKACKDLQGLAVAHANDFYSEHYSKERSFLKDIFGTLPLIN